MTTNGDPTAVANFINCLSVLEHNAYLLFTALSDKVSLPIVKSLLKSIADDDQRHSVILKCVSESIAKPNKPQDCAKNTGETWRIVDAFNLEISAKQRLSDEELSEKVEFLESVIGEDYCVLVQLKTLQVMINEINQIYKIDLRNLEDIFGNIINDEERHREILEKIKEILDAKNKTKSAILYPLKRC